MRNMRTGLYNKSLLQKNNLLTGGTQQVNASNHVQQQSTPAYSVFTTAQQLPRHGGSSGGQNFIDKYSS